MSVSGAIVAVGTSATAIASVPIGARPRGFAVQNVSDADVFLGGSDVTTTAYGHKLAAGASITVDLDGREVLYAVVASGPKSVAVLSAGW